MNELLLTIAAIAVELGIPLVAIIVLMKSPRFRAKAITILGAVMPLLIFYGWVAVAYFFNPSDRDNLFAFGAMWVMSFIAYVALLFVGALLSLVRRPSNLEARFALGCLSAPLSYLALNVVT